MPFVSNRMDWVKVDGRVIYTLPAPRELSIRLGASRIVSGRNVGQATTLTSGLFYTFHLWSTGASDAIAASPIRSRRDRLLRRGTRRLRLRQHHHVVGGAAAARDGESRQQRRQLADDRLEQPHAIRGCGSGGGDGRRVCGRAGRGQG